MGTECSLMESNSLRKVSRRTAGSQMSRYLSSLRLLILAFAALVPSGCKVSDAIRKVETDILFPEARLSWQFRPRDEGSLQSLWRETFETSPDERAATDAPEVTPPSGKPSHPKLILAADLEGTQFGGSFRQRVGDNDIEFDGKEFGPFTTIDVDYRVVNILATFRGGAWVSQYSAAEGLAGIGHMGIKMDVQDRLDPSIERSGRFDQEYAYLGGRLTGRPIQYISVYGRAVYALRLGGGNAGTHGDAELGIRFEPVPGVAFFGAWRYWREFIYTGRVESNVLLTFYGYVFGIHITF